MDEFIKHVVSEKDVIAQSPIAFSVALAVVSVFIWRTLDWRYGGAIASLEARNKLLADRIADYEAKLKGASPDEAKERLDALEATVAKLSPRSLSVEQFQKLKTQLLADPGRANITLGVTATNAKLLFADLERCFLEAGYHVSTWVANEQRIISTEISMKVSNVDQLTSRQAVVLDALRSVAMDVVVEHQADHPANKYPMDIWLTVR